MKKLRDIIKKKLFFINSDGHAVPHDPIKNKSKTRYIKEKMLTYTFGMQQYTIRIK